MPVSTEHIQRVTALQQQLQESVQREAMKRAAAFLGALALRLDPSTALDCKREAARLREALGR